MPGVDTGVNAIDAPRGDESMLPIDDRWRSLDAVDPRVDVGTQ